MYKIEPEEWMKIRDFAAGETCLFRLTVVSWSSKTPFYTLFYITVFYTIYLYLKLMFSATCNPLLDNELEFTLTHGYTDCWTFFSLEWCELIIISETQWTLMIIQWKHIVISRYHMMFWSLTQQSWVSTQIWVLCLLFEGLI